MTGRTKPSRYRPKFKKGDQIVETCLIDGKSLKRQGTISYFLLRSKTGEEWYMVDFIDSASSIRESHFELLVEESKVTELKKQPCRMKV